jgi:hypothetical protein
MTGYVPISLRQRLQPARWWQTTGIVALMAAVASIPLMIGAGAVLDRQAMKREWAITGPACPVATGPSVFHRPPKAFNYQGILFTRQYGNVNCVVVPDAGPFSSARHPVCQFSGPARITVAIADRSYAYDPDIGRKATVSIRHGEPSCVVGGWF